jgi:hypothetical protein
MDTHVKVVGVLFIVLSALGVLAALGVMALFGFSAGMVGMAAEGEDAALAIPFIGLTGTFLTVFLLVLSLPGLITGFGLLAFKPWARILGIVLSALNLINVPFGTILGVYGLFVLLHKDTERLFSGAPRALTHS